MAGAKKIGRHWSEKISEIAKLKLPEYSLGKDIEIVCKKTALNL